VEKESGFKRHAGKSWGSKWNMTLRDDDKK